MNEYRIQRLKEDLTYAQQRNKHQKQQLANYKNVHEKDLKEIERLNNIIKQTIGTIKELIDDSEDTTCYEITNTVKKLLLEELETGRSDE